MKSLLDVILLSETYLKERGVSRPRREAEDLIAFVLKLKRLDLYLQFERPLNEEELEKCREVVKRRGKREPFAYICQEIVFSDLVLKVTPHVLIPRQETEILVEKIAVKLATIPLDNKILWDMCTGSGCIGLALKKKFPQLNVFLSDISKEALLIAEENARLNNLEVHFRSGDLFEAFKGEKCDFFICNPPYVSEDDYRLLDPEVRAFEPKLALVGGKRGLSLYERLSKELKNYFNSNFLAWFEIGTGQGIEIKKIFNDQRIYSSHIEMDWAGHDRFFFLESVPSFQVS